MIQRIKFVDGLKGIACIIIFIHHIRLAFSHTLFVLDRLLSWSRLFHILVNGTWALILFYLLSGFSISMLVFGDETGEKMKKLCVTRIFRLGFPIMIILLITYVFQKMGILYDGEAAALLKNDWLDGILAFEGTFLQMCKYMLWDIWITSDNAWISILGSVRLFLLAPFAVIPIAFMLKKQKRKSAILLAVVLFLFLKKIRGEVYVCFLCGCFLAWIYTYSEWIQIVKTISGKWKWIINIVLLVAFLSAPAYGDIYCGKFSRHGFEGTIFAIMDYYYLASAICLVLLVMFNSKLEILLNNTGIQYLGKISYSVWIVHATVISAYSCFIYLLLRNNGIPHNWCTPPVFVSTLIVGVVGAAIFHHLIEVKLYHIFENKIKRLCS